MDNTPLILRYQRVYRLLIRLYPKSYRERFGESMDQTFLDMWNDRIKHNPKSLRSLGIILDTAKAIIREHIQSTTMTYLPVIRTALITTSLLIIPAALQLTMGTGIEGQGFNWRREDFVLFGIVLFITGLVIGCMLKMVKKPAHRIIGLSILGLVFLVLWAEMAVGLFGSPIAGS